MVLQLMMCWLMVLLLLVGGAAAGGHASSTSRTPATITATESSSSTALTSTSLATLITLGLGGEPGLETEKAAPSSVSIASISYALTSSESPTAASTTESPAIESQRIYFIVAITVGCFAVLLLLGLLIWCTSDRHSCGGDSSAVKSLRTNSADRRIWSSLSDGSIATQSASESTEISETIQLDDKTNPWAVATVERPTLTRSSLRSAVGNTGIPNVEYRRVSPLNLSFMVNNGSIGFGPSGPSTGGLSPHTNRRSLSSAGTSNPRFSRRPSSQMHQQGDDPFTDAHSIISATSLVHVSNAGIMASGPIFRVASSSELPGEPVGAGRQLEYPESPAISPHKRKSAIDYFGAWSPGGNSSRSVNQVSSVSSSASASVVPRNKSTPDLSNAASERTSHSQPASPTTPYDYAVGRRGAGVLTRSTSAVWTSHKPFLDDSRRSIHDDRAPFVRSSVPRSASTPSSPGIAGSALALRLEKMWGDLDDTSSSSESSYSQTTDSSSASSRQPWIITSQKLETPNQAVSPTFDRLPPAHSEETILRSGGSVSHVESVKEETPWSTNESKK